MATRATIRSLVFVFLWILVLPATAGSRKTILIVFDEDRDFPGLSVINQSLRETFRSTLAGDVEFCSESLNLSQFKGAGYDEVMRDFMRRKYANKRPDLIVAVMQPALDFLLHDDQSLFPGVPIVFCGVDASYLETHALPPNVSGVAVKRDFAPTVDIALRLQPDTRNLYVIGGTSAFDRQLQKIARRDLASFEKRIRITWLTDLAMPDLVAAVAKLPPNSAVLYLTLFSDGAGKAFVSHEALAQISSASSAPIFVALDQYLDRGVVGGHVFSFATHGRQAAFLGTQMLRGRKPPVLTQTAYSDVFDWRQLRRWGFDEKRLPAPSDIRNREQSVWELYRWYIAGGFMVFLFQSVLVVALLVSRAQRKRADAAAREAEAGRIKAEEEVHRQRHELAHALRLTNLGELAASIAHEIGQPLTGILTNARAVQRSVAEGSMTPEEIREALSDIEEDTARAADTIHRVRALVRKEPAERITVDMNCIVDDVIRLLRADMKLKDIDVEFHRAGRLPNVMGDPVQLRQVLVNLLVNAEDAIAADPGGPREIHIETMSAGESAVAVVVHDTGVGASDAEMDRMFERFVSTKPNGVGMGLAITRSIVDAHGGRIRATRNEGRGLSLHVEIPVRRD